MSRLAELETLLDQNPDDPFIIYALAREYEQNMATMQALLMYEHLVNQYPDYIATYYQYAKLLYTAGNKKEGIRLLQAGVEQGIIAKDMHAVGEMKGMLQVWLDDEEE
ncbi:MAG: tetratricopeptide repeat protein [Bacteroidota bacterium]|nr:tetratricopeptide repeat protein [Bacteroidota bacterium]